jgi:surface polysaccharide O-acyltransferase-like enzyme
MVSKLGSPSKWWSIGASSFFSFAVSSFLAFLGEPESSANKNIFMVIGFSLLILSVVLFAISIKEEKRLGYSKEEIQNEMDEMEEPYRSDK